MFCLAGYVAGLADFRCVLFDHRGHGASDAPADAKAYTVTDHVDDVVGLADHLGIEAFAFCGYSAGARVGYQLAADHPDRIAALVALGTVDPEVDVDPEEWREGARRVRAEGLAPLLAAEEIPQSLLDNLLATDREVVARGFECLASWTPWPLFPRIEAPTLIVAGELEDEGCAAAAARMPNGRAAILPGLGHVAAFADSAAVLAHMRPFLHETLGRR
jgi:pimeloyl-ACP methyl ester carboxylesterase